MRTTGSKVVPIPRKWVNGVVVPYELKTLNWQEEDDELFKLLYPIVYTAALNGAKAALEELIATGIGVDWGLVNQSVVAWAKKYTYDLVKGINGTTQKFLQTIIPDWIQSGAPLDDLVKLLEPMFGAIRAEMIATTEVTRAYFSGNVEAWKASGVVTGYIYRNAQDDAVCPICEPLEGQVFDLNDTEHAPPQHVRCRCWGHPVTA